MPNLRLFLPLGAPGLGGFDALALGFEVPFDGFGCFVQALVPKVAVVLECGRCGSVATHALDDVDVGAGRDGHGYSGVPELVSLKRGVDAGIDKQVLPNHSPARGGPHVAVFVGE